jgi:hypothetical protein
LVEKAQLTPKASATVEWLPATSAPLHSKPSRNPDTPTLVQSAATFLTRTLEDELIALKAPNHRSQG